MHLSSKYKQYGRNISLANRIFPKCLLKKSLRKNILFYVVSITENQAVIFVSTMYIAIYKYIFWKLLTFIFCPEQFLIIVIFFMYATIIM